MHTRKISIATFVIIILVTISTLLLGSVSVIVYNSYSSQQWERLHTHHAILADQLSIGLALPMWNLDQSQIDKIIDSIMKDSKVFGVQVRPAVEGQAIHVRARDAQWNSVVADEIVHSGGLLTEERSVAFSGESLGTASVFVTPEYVEQELGSALMATISIVFALNLVLILSLYLLLRRVVLKPLQEVEHYAMEVCAGSLVQGESAFRGAAYQGELGSLSLSIRKMILLLHARYFELQKSERRFRELIEHSPVAMSLSDPSGNTVYLNDKFVELLGYTIDDIPDLQRWGLRAYPDPDYRRKVKDLWDHAIERSMIEGTEIEALPYDVMCKNGDALTLEIGGALIGDSTVLVFKDITGRKRAEEELKKHREHLEDLVADRTGELENEIAERKAAEERLRVAKDAAESANRAKSAFLTNMSHELRTPLNIILGFTQLMAREPTTSTGQRKILDTIGRSGEHLLALINDILAMSKIEAGRMTLNEAIFDFHHTIECVEEMVRSRTDAKGLSLLMHCSEDIPRYIRTDEGKLRQVLLNLLGNAVKFTDKGGVELRVTMAEGGDRLAFRIDDTGMGVAEEEVERIFDPFVQTQSGLKSEEGTGLGLAISRRFVQMMGGDISVRSELNSGSSFRFDITISSADRIEAEVEQPPHRVIELAGDQPSYRILVAEDNTENRRLLCRLLDEVGFQVREATNGREAIKEYEKWRPDLIWMDLRMPEMDGLEATRRIKGTPGGYGTKIIALTASSFEENRSQVFAAGCDDFVSKPFREAEIFDAMEKHLGARYSYENKHGRSKMTGARVGPPDLAVPDCLAHMPHDLLDRMQRAVLLLDGDELRLVLEQVRQLDASVGNVLELLAGNFRHREILDLIGRARIEGNAQVLSIVTETSL